MDDDLNRILMEIENQSANLQRKARNKSAQRKSPKK